MDLADKVEMVTSISRKPPIWEAFLLNENFKSTQEAMLIP